MTLEELQEKAVKILKRKIQSIETKLDSNPIGELIQLRKQFSDKMKEYPQWWEHNEFLEYAKYAANKENKLKSQIREITDSGYYLSLLEEKSKLETELKNVQNEIILRGIRGGR